MFCIVGSHMPALSAKYLEHNECFALLHLTKLEGPRID